MYDNEKLLIVLLKGIRPRPQYLDCDETKKPVKRSDYLKTVEGQVSLRRKRKLNKLHFMIDGQEPRSKNAISKAEKIAFQGSILAKMTARKRRHFKAPVAIEFDFFPTENDPPALHSIPKNYLDLLERPIMGLARNRKRLLFENDRQVSYLAAKYHIGSEETRPGIWLKAAPYRDFVADIELLDKIQHNDLESVSDSLLYERSSLYWDKLVEDDDAMRNDDAVDELRDHENNKQFWVSRFGKDVYEAWREMYMRDVQNHILKTLSLTPSMLILLLSPLFSAMHRELDSIYEIMRGNLISEPFAINLKHSNLQQGESSVYKAFVKKTMASFRKKNSRLFPLIAQVGITILFQPPAFGSIDLDNLARRIVPFVNEELKPPSNRLINVDINRCRDPKLRQWFEEKRRVLKRMPKHSITHYQILQLPRLTNDSEHGFVRLLLEPGEHVETLWSKVQTLADKWQEHVDWP